MAAVRTTEPMGPPWDLRSDTVTRPTPEMRSAMAEADVGDDVYGEDPTVARLEEAVAAMVGKEAALFFPSGTMANLCAVLVHTRPGQSALLDAESHIAAYEGGGMARLAGVMPRYFPVSGRVPEVAELENMLPSTTDIHVAPASLFCLENTHTRAGGMVLVPEAVERAAAWARRRGLRFHLDGARLFNAAVALGRTPAELAREADSVMVSLSKGLSAPVGSLLAGPAAFIEEARRARKLVGGGMRQAGVLAAAGLVALREVERLAEDHATAENLAEALADVAPLRVRPAPPVRTNIILVDVPAGDPGVPNEEPLRPAAELAGCLKDEGVLVNALGPRTLRLVTHRYVPRSAVPDIVDRFRRAVAAFVSRRAPAR